MKIFYLPPAAIGVKCFFFLSGLLVVNSLLNYRDLFVYSIKRFFRIYPPLLFVILITTFLIGLFCTNLNIHDYLLDKGTWSYITKNISFRIWGNNDIGLPGVFIDNKYPISVNAPLWAISAECFSYIMIFALFAVSSFNKKIISFACYAVIIDFFMPRSFIFYWIPKDNSDLVAIPFCYALGILLALHKEKVKINWLLPLGLLIFLHIFNDNSFTEPLKYLAVFSVFVCFAKCKIALNFPKIPDISYGIFLFGWPLQQLICEIIPQANYFISFSISLLLAFVFGYITFKLVEQPSSKLQNKILNYYYKIKEGSK